MSAYTSLTAQLAAGRLTYPPRIYLRRAGGWWRGYDRRYGVRWRAANGAAALLIVASVLVPVLSQLAQGSRYKLSAATLGIVGQTDSTLASQLTYDAQGHTYEFNKAAVQQTDSNPLAKMQAQVGTANGKGGNKSLYALDVPQDLTRGVTYHDVNSQLSFSLVPEFSAAQGQDVSGHLVYPLSGGVQAVYTLKNNGLKEDIVVPSATADTMTFSYQLNLPKTLEAKVIPDSNGDLGIYSADPTLFGNISYGSASDQAAVEKARISSPKTYLVFGLPAPVVKTADGDAAAASARFELSGSRLSIIASGLSSLKAPFSIDPSVVVTSASDFTKGNDDGNISFGASGGISRGSLTGGTLSGGWQTTTVLPANLEQFGSAVYNGRLYVVGGVTQVNNAATTYNFSVYMATLGSSGTLGSWQTAAAMPAGSAITSLEVQAYNGYLYTLGGFGSGGSKNLVFYASINSDGTLGSWQSGSNLPQDNTALAAATYNGYMYVMGGGPSGGGGSYYSAVYYAAIHADGSLGSWTPTQSLLDVIGMAQGVAYNGYLYVVGGANGSGFINTVEYAPIQSDGSVGTWKQTSAINTAQYGGMAYASGGYMYYVGGWQTNGAQYAQINANGTLGTWAATSSYDSAAGYRYVQGAVYNGYAYVMGGRNTTTGNSSNEVEYAKIDSAGVLASYQTNTNPLSSSGGLWGGAAVAYNGYMYIMGGSNSTAIGSDVSTVYYAPLSTNGSIGTWTPTTAFGTARIGLAAVAYNGYMYIMGGFHSTSDTACSVTAGQLCADVQYAAISSSGTLGAWASAGANFSSTGRDSLGAFAYNGYLYVMGGEYSSGSSISAETDVGQIQANGTVTGWTTTGNLVSQTSEFAVAQAGPYVYVLGGRIGGGSNYNTTVEYAVLSNTGTITWATTTSFTNARASFTASANSGYVYMTGGAYGAGNNLYSDTQYARICMDSSTSDGCNGTVGTLGSWHTTSSFTTTRLAQMSTIYNGYLYVMGGCSNQGTLGNCAATANVRSDIQYAPINNGGSGSAGSWTSNSTSFTTARVFSSSVAYNGYLYVLGGEDGSYNPFNDVQYAPINANGTIGTWQYTYNSTSSSTQTGGFTTARSAFGIVTYNGYLYILGGSGSSGDLNDVQYAPINANGTIGTWQYTYNSTSSSTQTGGFTTARFGLGAVAYNGYMYVLGGDGDLTNVQYAPINADGTIGTWANTGSLLTGRSGFGAVAYNGYIYAIGGYSTGNSIVSVEYAPINAGGTLGSWRATTAIPTARNYINAAVYGGYVYVMGGYSNGTSLSDVEYAPINAGGTLGSWRATTSLPSPNFGYGAATYNGYMYTTGGQVSTSVLYTPLNSIARVGHYSKLLDLGSAMNVTGVVYTGIIPGGNAAITYRAAGSNGVFGSSAQANIIAGAGGCAGNTKNTRYLFITVTLDDSYGQGSGGAFPDVNGTNANLASLTVNYNPVHPTPNIRLRLGQTLQQGNLSPFDTCTG